MNDCLFCKIARKEIYSAIVYEDDNALAFLDINPNNHGHTLVVPKEHCKNILDISENVLASLSPAITKVSRAVYRGMNAVGLNITMNNESLAGQIVFHAHIHIIPRFEGDRLKVWIKKASYKEGEMEETAQKIIGAFA